MLSWRLWQTLSEPAFKNPIFNRIRNEHNKQRQSGEQLTIPRYVYVIIAIVLILLVIRVPHFFVLMIQIPALIIAILILLPLMLPFIILFVGGYLVSKIATDIHKEKRQYTYELLCASPHGSLNVNWFFASGILHRGNWFQWVKYGVRLTLRVSQVITIILAGFALISAVSGDLSTPIRTMINLVLLTGLYYTTVSQSLVMSMLIGIYVTSINISQRDSSLIGLLTYIVLQILPYLIAFFVFIGFNILLPDPHPLIAMGGDSIIFGSIILVRELCILRIWGQLAKRLNSNVDESILTRQMAVVHS